MAQSSQKEVFGYARADDALSDSASLRFIIAQAIMNIQTVTLVKVVAVSNSGGVSPVGSVDVLPLVHQLTGDGKTVPHGLIYNIPYFRLQGGSDAIILDPKVGDIGMCGFCSRDISSVKKNKAASPPSSLRNYTWSDGLYFGGFLNGTPSQYVCFSEGGIEIVSPSKVTIKAPSIELNGHTTLIGSLDQSGGSTSSSGSISAAQGVTGAGVTLQSHTHPEHDGGNTGVPN